jgi:hypothetical protein
MPVDGVLGEAQLAGDLLGAQVTIDKTKAFALTLGESIEAAAQPAGRLGQMARPLVHGAILGQARC